MNWTLSIKLRPGEEVVDETADGHKYGIKAVYTPILTSQRVLFKFNSLSTGLLQSFPYEEITDVQPVTRLLIRYLKLTVKGRSYYMNVDDPDALAEKILDCKERFGGAAHAGATPGRRPSMTDLLKMLVTLKEYGVITGDEFEQKRRLLLS